MIIAVEVVRVWPQVPVRSDLRFINDRLCDKLDQRRTALDRQNLLLDRSRETPGRTYERVQRFPGDCRCDQSKENDYAKHAAIISD